MANERDDDIHTRVSARLKELRTERGLTLADVAGAAGMDTSTLSRLESGARRLTLDHLPPLARALGVRADDLLGTAPVSDPRIRPRPFDMRGTTVWPLNPDPSTAQHRVYRMRIPVRRGEPELRTHEGHDWMYVLSGRLRLVLGEDEFLLEPGEVVEFSCWTPHWMGAVDGPAEVISIFGPHGERAHVAR
jgi:transcriptional regulator with XRE-family HTH domain